MSHEVSKNVYVDPDNSVWMNHANINDFFQQAQKYGQEIVGNFGFENLRDFYILSLNRCDQKWIDGILTLKDDERIFRYMSQATLVGNFLPIIKINIRTGYVSFLMEDAEQITFQKAERASYLRYDGSKVK